MTHSLKIARLAEVYPRADRVLNRNSRIVLFPHLPAVATSPANCAPAWDPTGSDSICRFAPPQRN